MEPSKLSYKLLKQITNDFDKDRILGSGGFGTVYKGVDENRGDIAVKVLHNISGFDDKEFHKEFDNLRGLKHPNIVELIGFCNESEKEILVFEEKQVTAERLRMALCFEYVHNGSLANFISAEKTGFTWHTRYRIIKGICEGLKYLHEGLEYPIMHFNLKPDNILLDKNMVPKIADIGLSKLFGEQNTMKTLTSVGTIGYWPPEYIKHQIISRQFDIFSLGVIIVKIMTGYEGYNSTTEMPTRRAVKLVHDIWKKRLCQTLSSKALEVHCNQVKRCIEIALDCLHSNRRERPTIDEIVSVLNETETMIGDGGMQSEQYYQDDGESTHPSRIPSMSIDSEPSSGPTLCLDSSTGTHLPANHHLFSGSSSTDNKEHHEPNKLPYQLIKRITKDFHEDGILGRGGFGTVYKGVHENKEEIAVKVLHSTTDLNDKKFQKEFDNLKSLKHRNIMELVGYCKEEEQELLELDGKRIHVVRIHLALCFEYVHNGSLENYISDERMRFDWDTRYKIINGICEGLKYLHDKQIIHRDLKPGNILLDKNYMVKIADFGLSELFGDDNTRKTMISVGTGRYQPPEFTDRQVISDKFDIYSLGVITVIIMTGHEGYDSGVGTITPNSVNLVHESWMKKLRGTLNLELSSRQVKRCIEIAIDCLNSNRHQRPTIGEIVSRLNEKYCEDKEVSTCRSRFSIHSGTSFGHGEASSVATNMETAQHGSSLDRYISDISSGLDWRTRYGIIKGICEGLKELHEGSNSPIIHMNVKINNIWLDENMIPKLGDIGVPILTGEGTATKTTIEHMPPEFIEKQVITKEFDIYSLGVIILKVMTGEQLYSNIIDMPSMEFMELAHEGWRERLQKTVNAVSVEGYCQQVKECLEIAFYCVEADRGKRPIIRDIICKLSKTETMTPAEQVDLDTKDSELPTEAHPLELLFDVQPLELRFQFMLSSKLPRKKDVSCLLQLNNRGKGLVAFMLVANNFKKFLTKKPMCGVVRPESTYTLTLIMPKLPPLPDEDDIFTLHSVAVGEYDLRDVGRGSSVPNEYAKFFKKFAKDVQEVVLKVLCCQDADDQGTSLSEVITTSDAQQVSSIDVHPEEPWIVTTNHVGSLRVWDYQTMTPLNSFKLLRNEPVHEAKFIARVKWLVAGDRNGGIHVYNYDQNQHVNSFEAHDSRITTLAVHRTHPYILTSSAEDDDHLIKLWDWGNGWECTRIFKGHTDRVTQVVFNPEDEDSFASASWDGTVKIWSIYCDEPKITIILESDEYAVESLLCVDYFTRCDRQHLIVGCKDKTAQICKLGMKGCVDELAGHADRVTAVNLHPKLPILITGSLDGTVCIWDSTKYKPINTIAFNLGAVHAFGIIKGSTRIVVGCDQGMATMEIASPQEDYVGSRET